MPSYRNGQAFIDHDMSNAAASSDSGNKKSVITRPVDKNPIDAPVESNDVLPDDFMSVFSGGDETVPAGILEAAIHGDNVPIVDLPEDAQKTSQEAPEASVGEEASKESPVGLSSEKAVSEPQKAIHADVEPKEVPIEASRRSRLSSGRPTERSDDIDHMDRADRMDSRRSVDRQVVSTGEYIDVQSITRYARSPMALKQADSEEVNLAASSILRRFPKPVIDYARTSFPTAVSNTDAVVAYMATHCGNDMMEVIRKYLTKSQVLLIRDWKGDLQPRLEDRLDAIMTRLSAISDLLKEIELLDGYSLFDRLGYRHSQLPETPRELDFMRDDGVFDILVAAARQSKKLQAEKKAVIDRAIRRGDIKN